MKLFIFKIFIFFAIVLLCDFAAGALFKLLDYTKRGEAHKMHRLMTNETPDLLILGSSRACHHYNPKLIGDSLGLDVFNAGFDGAGTSVGYGILSGIAQRRFPKYILCDITPDPDLYDEPGVVRGIDSFYPYTDIPQIRDLVTDFDTTEKWKLLSNCYRLNSKIVRIIPSILLDSDDNMAGFTPLHGMIEDGKYYWNKQTEHKINQTKAEYLRKLIRYARSNGCEIVFAISPVYGGQDISSFKDELEILNEYNVKILNYLNKQSIIYNNEYFQDDIHMNMNGAQKYSEMIATDLMNYYSSYN